MASKTLLPSSSPTFLVRRNIHSLTPTLTAAIQAALGSSTWPCSSMSIACECECDGRNDGRCGSDDSGFDSGKGTSVSSWPGAKGAREHIVSASGESRVGDGMRRRGTDIVAVQPDPDAPEHEDRRDGPHADRVKLSEPVPLCACAKRRRDRVRQYCPRAGDGSGRERTDGKSLVGGRRDMLLLGRAASGRPGERGGEQRAQGSQYMHLWHRLVRRRLPTRSRQAYVRALADRTRRRRDAWRRGAERGRTSRRG